MNFEVSGDLNQLTTWPSLSEIKTDCVQVGANQMATIDMNSPSERNKMMLFSIKPDFEIGLLHVTGQKKESAQGNGRTNHWRTNHYLGFSFGTDLDVVKSQLAMALKDQYSCMDNCDLVIINKNRYGSEIYNALTNQSNFLIGDIKEEVNIPSSSKAILVFVPEKREIHVRHEKKIVSTRKVFNFTNQW